MPESATHESVAVWRQNKGSLQWYLNARLITYNNQMLKMPIVSFGHMSGKPFLHLFVILLMCLGTADIWGMEYYTAHYTDTISDDVYHIILRCTDDVLIYGLELGIYGHPYLISRNSIAVGHETIRNPPYAFEYGASHDLLTQVTPWGIMTHSRPVALAYHTPLTIPVSTYDVAADTSAALYMQVTYAAGPDVQCEMHGGLKGPQPIGIIIPGMGPLAAISADMEKTILRAIDDFNAHLASADKSWSLEPHVVYDDITPDASRHAAATLQQNGITAAIGPITDAGLEGVRIYDGKMVFVSCCSSDASLAIFDHIFRLDSPGHDHTRALASLVTYGDIGHVILVRDTDSDDADRLVLYLVNDTSITTVWNKPEHPDEVARELNRLISSAPNDTAVVIIGGIDALHVLDASSAYPPIYDSDDIPWYTTGELARALAIASNRPDPLMDLTGVQAGPVYGHTNVYDILRAELGLSEPYQVGLHLYRLYDSVWFLGNAIDASQSLQPDVLASAIPAIAPQYAASSGILGFDHNGDAIAIQYGIWHMFADQWVQVGEINSLDDSVRYVPWYNPR